MYETLTRRGLISLEAQSASVLLAHHFSLLFFPFLALTALQRTSRPAFSRHPQPNPESQASESKHYVLHMSANTRSKFLAYALP